jgi:hypothetical protein
MAIGSICGLIAAGDFVPHPTNSHRFRAFVNSARRLNWERPPEVVVMVRVRHALVGLFALACFAAPAAARSETRSAARPAQAKAGAAAPVDAQQEARTPAPYRARMGYADLYIPGWFQPERGAYDVIVHFHGVPNLQEDNIERVHLNAIVISVTLGIGSGAYSGYFESPKVFEALVERTQREIEKSGRAPGARLGRIAITAWSAGFGAVGQILSQPANAERIDAILLADGLHANYLNGRKINDAALAKYATFAERAMRGEKLFALTHSSIQTEGYPSTTATIGELLVLTDVAKTPTPGQLGPRGMREIYQSDRGEFHVKGYEGMGVQDHVDHIKGMYETVFPYLKARWSKR